jgi:serine phosphatase RsbU (regulator of sigma subunit)
MANTRRREKTEERGPDGMPIWARFTLSMALALTVVSAGAGFVLYQSVRQLSSNVQTDTMVAAVTRTAPMFHAEIERQRLRAEREVFFSLEQQVAKDVTQTSKDFPELQNEHRYEGVRKAFANYELGLREALKAQREQREARYKELNANTPWQTDGTGIAHGLGDVIQAPVKYADGTAGVVYQYKVREGQPPVFILLPDSTQLAERSLFGLVVGITLVIILVGAAVSLWVANQVSGPIVKIVDDVRVIAGGNLNHRVSAQAGGEVGTLARAIDRMTKNLAEARDNEVELEVRQREVRIAAEVREQLLPQSTPKLAGYEVGHLHIASPQLGGDFLDYVESTSGLGLLVCEVSGKGLPGAIVGATARSYLQAKLTDATELAPALQAANRQLARDVRRGIAVTSLFARIDAVEGIASVACTGHKVPLIRFTGADRKVRVVHPEGIALGFDKGPVFDGKLEIAKVPIESGDRLVLVNSGAVTLADAEGNELGEKGLYALVMKFGALSTEDFLARLREALEAHAGDATQARDISIVTVRRV